MARFLARAGWDGGLTSPPERDLLRSLRKLLRRMVDALIAAEPVGPEDLGALNGFLASSPLIPRLVILGSGWRLSQVPSAEGIERVVVTVALSFASMLAEGDPTRVKTCANPDCGWVIYDQSHNRTRRWCDVKECGNLIKVRRFRARRRSPRS